MQSTAWEEKVIGIKLQEKACLPDDHDKWDQGHSYLRSQPLDLVQMYKKHLDHCLPIPEY